MYAREYTDWPGGPPQHATPHASSCVDAGGTTHDKDKGKDKGGKGRGPPRGVKKGGSGEHQSVIYYIHSLMNATLVQPQAQERRRQGDKRKREGEGGQARLLLAEV